MPPKFTRRKMLLIGLLPLSAKGVGALTFDAGTFHTCTAQTNGKVLCWGMNSDGQLGDGTTTSRTIPVEVLGITTATSVALGSYESCAVLTNGKVMCWGDNEHGTLGDGTTTSSSTPVEVSGITTATSVALSYDHSCALLSDGKVKCWGLNDEGQLGDGTTTNSLTPMSVSGITTATSIAVGNDHSCALLSNKTVTCWGSGLDLADGQGVDSSTPVLISGITTATSIATNFQHSCAMLTNRTVECWGFNSDGQLGDGTTTSSYRTTVTVLGITTAKNIDLGSSHSCAVLTDGKVKCWGENDMGQLGDGTTTDRSTPVEVSGITSATSIVLGSDHSCAVLTDGTAKCWGDNSAGELGDGTKTDRATPVEVTFLLSPPPPPPPTSPLTLTSCLSGTGSFPVTTAGIECVRYCFQCTSGDTSCTAEQIASGTMLPAYTAVASSTVTQMRALPTLYKNLFACSTNDCNTRDDNSCSQLSPPPSSATSPSPAVSSVHRHLCADPSAYNGSLSQEKNTLGYTCDAYITMGSVSGGAFYGLDLTKTFNCADASYLGRYYINYIGQSCCIDGKATCFANYSKICHDPSKYDGTGLYEGNMNCDFYIWSIMESALSASSPLYGEDFSQAWTCDGKSAMVRSYFTTPGQTCCSDGKSACTSPVPPPPPSSSLSSTTPVASTSTSDAPSSPRTYISLAAVCMTLMLAF